MKRYDFDYSFKSGNQVTEAHFGANMVFSANSLGSGETMTAAQNLTGATGIRYPGGSVTEKFFDVKNPENDRAGSVELVPLSKFMTWCNHNQISPIIVVPTKGLIDPDTGTISLTAVQDIKNYITYILEKFPEVEIFGFEIGNEYWGDDVNATSSEYGMMVNAVAPVIQEVLDGYFSIDIEQPGIYAQMGAAWGPEFDTTENRLLSWDAKVEKANLDIIHELGSEAREALDGVIEHYYLGAGSHLLDQDTFDWTSASATDRQVQDATNFIGVDLKYWTNAGMDVSLILTEWGVSPSLLNQTGMKGASALLAQFDTMLDLGVSAAYAWPLQLNSSVDLAGAQNTVPSLTPLGAAFNLMAEELPGTTQIDGGIHGGVVEVSGYANDEQEVFLVSSRSADVQTFRLDLSDQIDSYSSIEGVRLSVVDGTANGRHWQNGSSRDAVIYAEHDVSVEHIAMDATQLRGGTTLELTLQPYEIVRIEYTLPASETYEGSNVGDTYQGGNGNDLINGNDGNDVLTGGRGHDHIFGGSGSDRLNGWGGNDDLHGGDGRDVIFGNQGHDVVEGGRGDDRLYGGSDSDLFVFFGGDGNDKILDFQDGIDLISFVAAGSDPLVHFDDLSIREATSNGVRGVMIDYDQDHVFVANLEVDNLTEEDFLFVRDHELVGVSKRPLSEDNSDATLHADHDWITPGLESDRADGGEGIDMISSSDLGGPEGGDHYDGGSGSDTMSYTESGAAADASLLSGYGSGGDTRRDPYLSIENLTYSASSDVLTGDNGRNMLSGLDRAYRLYGLGVIDYPQGGDGDDYLDGRPSWNYALDAHDRADYEVTTDAQGVGIEILPFAYGDLWL